MKIRTGFVSNSSSSSFIVAGKKGVHKGKICIEINLNEMSHTIIETVDQLNAYIVGEYGYDDADTIEKLFEEDYFTREEYDKLLKVIEGGDVLYFGEVCTDSGNETEEFVANHGFCDLGPNFNIIQDAGGY